VGFGAMAVTYYCCCFCDDDLGASRLLADVDG
jgi:hypothetical protein